MNGPPTVPLITSLTPSSPSPPTPAPPRAAAGASFTLLGAGVGDGVAIGFAHLVSSARLEVAQYAITAEEIGAELARFDHAVATVERELAELSSTDNAPTELAGFVNLHRMILADTTVSKAPRTLIQAHYCNAEWALVQQMEHLVAQFDAMEDDYLRQRKADVQQVVERVLKALLGTAHAPVAPAVTTSLGRDVIVVAHDLSPADMMLFRHQHFAGFVTDVGGVTSHTAIVARSLDLPAIVGLHHARQMIRENEQLVLDSEAGVLIVNPDQQILDEYRVKQSTQRLKREKLKRLKSTPATTLDGTAIELHANIELPEDVDDALEAGATGVGLFRSEFLFLNRSELPSEDEQFEAYRKVAVAMHGAPVTIRTLDLGADKALGAASLSGPNPALGLRAIRLCLAEPKLFLGQLRAILRASAFGRIRLLLPMLAHAHEVVQALGMIDEAKAMLEEQGIDYDKEIPIGGMIEVPAAALALPIFLKRLDFLSIGTNDLIQYTLAIDRTDDHVAHLYDPLHPAVLGLVANTIRTATRAGVPIAVCGEMAGETSLTRLLLGFGLRQFSMHPGEMLAVKQQVLRADLPSAEAGANRVLRAIDRDRIRAQLDKLNGVTGHNLDDD